MSATNGMSADMIATMERMRKLGCTVVTKNAVYLPTGQPSRPRCQPATNTRKITQASDIKTAADVMGNGTYVTLTGTLTYDQCKRFDVAHKRMKKGEEYAISMYWKNGCYWQEEAHVNGRAYDHNCYDESMFPEVIQALLDRNISIEIVGQI